MRVWICRSLYIGALSLLIIAQYAVIFKSALPVATTAPTSTVSANVDPSVTTKEVKDEFCSECIWDNEITCEARADYLARKYFSHDQDAVLQSILVDPTLKQCHQLPRPCIMAPYTSGWGNAVYKVLYHLASQQNHQ